MASRPPHSYPPFLNLCLGDRVEEFRQMVERFPGLVNEPIPIRQALDLLGESLHPVEYALLHRAHGVAALLLAHPGIEGGRWPQRMLVLLSKGFCLQMERSRQALSLFPHLARLGASPLKPDLERRGEVPLFSVIAYTSALFDFMGSMHGYLSCFPLGDAPPMGREARLGFDRVFSRFDEPKWEDALVSQFLLQGETVPARFDKVVPTLVDWLCGAGWADPVFLEWARIKAPDVMILRDQERLEGVLPEAGAGLSGSPRRL